ncbi:protein ANTAGONIST OF LIKE HETEROCHROMATIN PROTEIN 1-like [Lolium rigidum]|uniref:protein ANTAGONIST OF LIKE HETEROCHROMATIN PROTEIN 1-like n=1 Tax=Lolium rigidum TaxID=89674 RepID=UPI001F5DEB86|nr:protein ANTAGONIST OF LIKE HETEROCHROMATIN PROTEIN 1-like [Lolium rigidum]XP_047072714.1 protein ANTAGONIST OF LIKE HETEROCHROMATIN PROTEIN 1-like [Lolium rigidum]
MRSPSTARPTTGLGGPAGLATDDDFAFYYSFFQDAAAASPLALDETLAAAMPNTRRRKRGADDAAAPNSQDDGPERKRSIAKIITSLAALDAEGHADSAGAADASRRELALLESNADSKSQAMMDYYAKMEGSFHADADSEAAARSRLSASAAATAAVAAVEEAAAAATATNTTASASPPRAGHHQRRLWVKDRSQAWWDRCNSPDFPEAEFRRAFRMGRETFDMICDALGAAVAKEDTMLRAAIPVRQRVAVCIWRLATGEPLRLVSKRFGLGISTCHKLVLEVCGAIKSVLMPRFLQWPDQAAAGTFKDGFERSFGVPGVIGAMYTTHIPIIAPKISVAAYFNRRHTERNQKTSYSITLQGVVGPDRAFTDVCIGWPGSMPDDQVLEKSMLHQRAAAGMMHDACLVGGASYPLNDWVLVPYTHQNLTWTQHAFNEKVGDIRNVAVDAFARLKTRWACLQKRTEVKLQDLPVVLGACCVLHNICEMRREELEPETPFPLVDDDTTPENPVRSETAKQARDSIAHNLLHRGFAGTTFF